LIALVLAMNPSIKKNDIVELQISDLAYGGTGVARVNGFVVLVLGGIPGDVVKAQITKRKPNYAEAEIREVVRESDLRIEPRCSHFGLCGGCTWQNLKYEEQLRFKTKEVRESLKHIGGFAEPPVADALGSQDVFFYRNKMEYAFLPHAEKKLVLGLHPRRRYDLVFDLKECFLQSEQANQVVDFVRRYARETGIPAYDHRTRSGLLRFLMIKEAKNTGISMVNLVTYRGEFPQEGHLADSIMTNFPKVKSVVRNINSKPAHVAVGEEEELLAGERTITETLGDFTFEISSNSFFQTNPKQAERLYQVVLQKAELQGEENVLDLYCGNGTISMFLTTRAKTVTGVDSVPETVENARRNAELNRVANCKFILGEARKVLKEFEQGKRLFDLVVTDPPRAGLHPKVVKSLLAVKPPKIIYVSCNPTTLARDLKILCENDYRLTAVQPVDMFPHTYHIESVAELVRN
jgi:23S rRNA (uracil1939-C5)-methyltransferase